MKPYFYFHGSFILPVFYHEVFYFLCIILALSQK